MMDAISFYKQAKLHVINLGYSSEIDWQASQVPTRITETEFLREAAWVIYCSGFRESTVRKYFQFISLCFCDWESAEDIVASAPACIAASMLVFRNKAKHDAVVAIATRIDSEGFERFMQSVILAPYTILQQLPFIGPVTALHLAKNLGFDVAKPDRHLIRLHGRLGFDDVDEMCQAIAYATGDSIKVVDLVLWRFLEREGFGSLH